MLLADNLNALGLSAITRPERQQAFERLQVPPAAVLTDATVIRIAQLVGAAQVIVGSLQREDDGLVVRARSLALEAGRVQADVTERGPDRRAVRDLRPDRARVSRRPSTPTASTRSSTRQRRATAGRGVRELHQGAAGRDAGDGHQLSERGVDAPSGLRPRRLALWDVHAEQGDHQRALAAVQPVPACVAVGAARALPRRALAAQPEEARRCVRDVQGAGRRAADADRSQQSGRRAAAARRQPAERAADVLLRQGGAKPIPTIPTTSSISGYAYWAAQRHAGGDVLAARGGPAESRRRRRAFRARRRAGGVGQCAPSRRAKRSWRGACRRPTTNGRSGRPPSRCPGPRARQEQRGRAAARAADRHEDQRDRHSAISRSWRRSIWIARGACSSRRAIARRSPSSIARCICRRTWPRRTCCSGAFICGTDAVREAIDALKISLWSAETAEAPYGAGRGVLQAKDAEQARAEAERALALDPSSAEAKTAPRHAKIALSLTAHTQDDGFHEIQLNGKQLVFLFMAATVVSVVIFLCGVLVGRGVRAERERRSRRRRVERRGGTDAAAAPRRRRRLQRGRTRPPPPRRQPSTISATSIASRRRIRRRSS